MKFSDKLIMLLRRDRITKVELAHKMGFNGSSIITHWVNGRNRPNWENIEKLAKVFSKPPDFFFDDEGLPSRNSSVKEEGDEYKRGDARPSPRIEQIPVLGAISSSEFDIPLLSAVAEEHLSLTVDQSEKMVFALKICSEFLSPKAKKGDYAVIASTHFVENGKTGLVFFNGRYALCEIYRKEKTAEIKIINGKTHKIDYERLDIAGKLIFFLRKP